MVKFMTEQRSKSTLGNDFWYKTIPVLALGMGFWFATSLTFSGLLGFTLIEFTLGITILLIVMYLFFWIITIILAFYKKNILSMIFFFGASLITGILGSSILIWATSIVGEEIVLPLFFMASFIGLLVTFAILVLGLIFRDKIHENWIYPLLIFGFILVVLEFTLILIFGFNTVILVTSVLVLIWLFAIILWDGSRLPEIIDEGFWMLAVINLFLDLINVIIRIFIIIVKIIGDAVD